MFPPPTARDVFQTQNWTRERSTHNHSLTSPRKPGTGMSGDPQTVRLDRLSTEDLPRNRFTHFRSCFTISSKGSTGERSVWQIAQPLVGVFPSGAS